MGWLSNFLGHRDGRDDPPPTVLRPARPGELEAAVRLILAPPAGGATPEAQVQDFITFAHARGIDLGLLCVAAEGEKPPAKSPDRRAGAPVDHSADPPAGPAPGGGRVVLAALPVVSPGRTMLVFASPPLNVKGDHGAGEALLRQLIDRVCRQAADRDVHLAQALLDVSDDAQRRAFAGAGFVTMAELHYLSLPVKAGLPPPPLPDGFAWRTFSPATYALFARAILASYQQSLDCPALNGLREIDDIILGHQCSGTFDPDQWFVLVESLEGESMAGETPLGVLLLSPSPRADSAELVYLGLCPAARGRRVEPAAMKLSELMMRQAIAAVSRLGLGRLSLAVDSKNVPALKLYYRHGGHRVGQRLALMRDLRRMTP